MADMEKTEQPTAKRRSKAAEEGQVLRSREFATAAVVLGGVLWLALAAYAVYGVNALQFVFKLRAARRDVALAALEVTVFTAADAVGGATA